MNNKVSVVKCDRYSEVQNAVENAVSLIGGIGKFVKKGDNVVIKPNLVSKKKPEEAVTTNPEFLHAVIVMVEKAGGNVTIAESPGGPYNTTALKGVYSVCGGPFPSGALPESAHELPEWSAPGHPAAHRPLRNNHCGK